MTRAQVVRRKFKSGLPRKIENRRLSVMEALARTMDLFDRLRNEMEAAGLKKSHVSAGLIFYQPQTKGKEHVLAETIILPEPGEIGTFCDRVMALDKPVFLGVIFHQHDPEAEKPDQQNVIFVWPFLDGPDERGRLVAARNQQAKGGLKKVAN